MSAVVIPFPARARPRDAHLHARASAIVNQAGEIYRWKDKDGWWNVEWMSASGDSACIVARYAKPCQADKHIALWWRANGGADPKGAA